MPHLDIDIEADVGIYIDPGFAYYCDTCDRMATLMPDLTHVGPTTVAVLIPVPAHPWG